MRRSFTLLVLLAIVVATGWWLLNWPQGGPKAVDPWLALPADAGLVVELPTPLDSWQRFTNTSQFRDDLEQAPAFAAIDSLFRSLADAVAADPDLARRTGAEPLVISWSQQGDSSTILVVWPMAKQPANLALLGKLFHQTLSASLWQEGPVSVRPDTALPRMELAWKKGLLLLGTDAGTVAQAAARLDGADADRADLAKARASFSAGSDAHLLLRTDSAANRLPHWVRALFPGERDMPGIAALDVRLRPGALLMNGLFFPADSTAAIAAIRGQHAGPIGILRVLPANVCQLRTAVVSDPRSFVEARMGKVADEDLFAAYAAWVQGGVGVAGAPADGDSLGRHWAVLMTGDPGAAREAMDRRCADAACDTSTYRGFRMARMGDPGALQALFGPDFAPFQQPLWTILDGCVVLTNTPGDLRAAIDAWVDRNSLALDPRSGDFFRQFASDAAWSGWSEVALGGAGGSSAAKNPLLRGIGACLVQCTPRADGALVTTVCIGHAGTGKQEAGALWTVAMASPLERAPVLVKDYLSKTLQVLVQDRDHRISLISCTGKVLWQRQLDGPLLGAVQLVDRYRNGKLQLLFNTAGTVWLMDRLGRDVEGFPLVLKGQACAPLSLFDYDGNKDYRVLVPMADRRLLNYGMDGKPVQGWRSDALPAPLAAPVEHVRIKGKDFLIAVMRNGQPAVLDRRGEPRYAAKLRMPDLETFLGSRPAMDIGAWQLLWADSAGAVLSGALDGAVDTLSGTMSGKATLLQADGRDEVARTLPASVAVQDRGAVRWTASLPDDPDAAAFAVPLEDGAQALGVVLPGRGQVRLYDAQGALWPGFPMKGAQRFVVADINLDGALEVVAADRDGVVSAQPLAPPP